MMLRIIHGKLKPGTWDSYESAYKDVIAKAGKIPGLRGRWLAHAVDDPDAGYTIRLWESGRRCARTRTVKCCRTAIETFGRLHDNALRGPVG